MSINWDSARIRLERTLADVEHALELLLQAMERKTEALTHFDPERVEVASTACNVAAERLADVEQQRQDALVAACNQLGLPLDPVPTLTMVADQAKGAAGDELRSRRRALKKLTRQIDRQNGLNGALCEQSLRHVNGFFAAVAKGMRTNTGDTYGPIQQTARPAATAAAPVLILDRKA